MIESNDYLHMLSLFLRFREILFYSPCHRIFIMVYWLYKRYRGEFELKKLPFGVQNFKQIITDNYVYIDKTQYIYNLINKEVYYFAADPKGFGKSLLIDTIREVFSGDKELFKGLWIYDSDYSFKKHPVLRFDMNHIPNGTPDELEDSLSKALLNRVRAEDLDLYGEWPPELFQCLIEGLYKKYNQKVVVLVDDYDKFSLNSIYDKKTVHANNRVICDLYESFQSARPYIKFLLITGESIFLRLKYNDLLDITRTKEYCNICGISIDSLEKSFNVRH